MRRTFPWTAVAFLAGGIVLGFLLGGISPRAELVGRDAEIVELTERLEEAGPRGGWRSPVPGFDRILRAPTPLPAAGRAELEPYEGDEPAEPRGGEDLLVDGGTPPPRPGWRERWRREGGDERLEAFQEAASIQRVRRVQSRAALQQQAGLDDEEMERVDAALTTMNEELNGYGEELLMLAMGDGAPPARDLLGITHDVTGILHQAQLGLEEVLGPERAAAVDPSALEIWNHIDLSQLEPAARGVLERAP